MKFKKTMRERYPRKTKKAILKYVTRSGYYEVVHFKERCSVRIDMGNGESFSVIILGDTPVYLEGHVTFDSLAEAQANHYKRFYSTPCAEADAIVAELKESAKSQPKNMIREEEIAYILGEYGVSSSLVESVNRCSSCDAFCECSLGALPANCDDEACKYYSHE